MLFQRQVKTLHVEYRQELAELTKKLANAQKEENVGVGGMTTRTQTIIKRFESQPQQQQQQQVNRSNSFVDNRIKQLESALQTEKRLLTEKETEIENLHKQVTNNSLFVSCDIPLQIEEVENNEDQLIDDKTRALTALNEAVQKLESRHDEFKKLQSVQDEMSKELQRAYDQIADLEDVARDVESNLRKKDEDISYWRRMYERRIAPSDVDSQSEAVSEIVDRIQCKQFDE